MEYINNKIKKIQFNLNSKKNLSNIQINLEEENLKYLNNLSQLYNCSLEELINLILKEEIIKDKKEELKQKYPNCEIMDEFEYNNFLNKIYITEDIQEKKDIIVIDYSNIQNFSFSKYI